jgi:putative glutamine amidotransferase
MVRSNDADDHPEVHLHEAAILALGGEPVVLPKDLEVAQLLNRFELSGVIFSGGGDVNAVHYGGREELSNDRVDDERDAFEMSLMREVLAAKIPTLCVCRGFQIANVVLGGTLIEHLPEHLGENYTISHHQRKDLGLDSTAYAHEISVSPKAMLHDIVRTDRLRVNSFHHQAIRNPASGMVVEAVADDGIIEAASLDGFSTFFLGVQWHPELLHNRDEQASRIYEHFVRSADRKH